ncbi:hypothetical protein SARI_03216 [Salmonella enterica subsp. arizonae serovar 62:z4,z23:-]|uniref:Uncharacterized protein n=1 Tax=Salmonella arizonae (strain ATCC BAA-731 / CDC346-86 / RSK2980) TaxID=41514 RepID=A9MEY6_SALAR|nr:hypothetical protein SARI_03216 [Salmonella enterica subsp. arizonae serovar 62:z4,z23:-]
MMVVTPHVNAQYVVKKDFLINTLVSIIVILDGKLFGVKPVNQE